MVNVNLLKSYMVRAGYTQKKLAQELGISEQTLTRKLKKRVFGTDEASKIVELLSIDNPQAVFFGHRVTCEVTSKEVNNVNDNKKPSEPVEEERWALENVPTAQLVEELVSRDGVETYRIEPYQLKTLSAEGPAIVLIVTD